ncbi:hypothetical protein MMC22_007992 [Lobaria immixta]|nr:hypothetical protein [Lobaria immixta]
MSALKLSRLPQPLGRSLQKLHKIPPAPPEAPRKDFSYLQQPGIYHALTQQDVPLPFRNPSHQPPPSTPLSTLLSSFNFRAAAIAAAYQLCTSSTLPHAEIFSLLYTRLACLTLINATPFAAEESKALEDLNSSFYRDSRTQAHFLPWELRVLAVRLQGIGYGDSKRGVSGYYDLARDAREQIAKTVGDERRMWKERLEDLGVRVGNALIEMGDFAGAARHFESLRRRGGSDDVLLDGRLALLYLRLGDVAGARRYVEAVKDGHGMLRPLLSMAEGRYEDAIAEWRELREGLDSEIVMQNLAVCLVYTGRLEETTSLLTSLIGAGHSFRALTFNLATVYELCSEKSQGKKIALAEQVAAGMMRRNSEGEDGIGGDRGGREKVNADFKL